MVNLKEEIFQISSKEEFERIALEVFRYQAQNIPIYKEYIERLRINPEEINHSEKIPFLPIQFFKSREIKPIGVEASAVFESSGTTGSQTSRHFVADIELYIKSFTLAFSHFYGNPADYCILALLPSYIERQGSSLVFMVDRLIKQSKHPESGFFLNEFDNLAEILNRLDSNGQKCLLIGVSFALVDFTEKHTFKLKNSLVMETGGMKGRRKEMIREELHHQLCNAFGLKGIHSEYGMTELLSQAYSDGKGIFKCPNWMKVVIRDPYDPFSTLSHQKAGAVNIIDLANIYSCSFIQTEDLGKTHDDGSFEILGRMNEAQLRGCNLLVY
ncbi:MAG: acyl transferase [Bacteroidales bacterium]|nr:acyl transferase [Bacteroidales bacterium]